MTKALLGFAILGLAFFTASSIAHASTKSIEDEVMELLVRESSTITLFNADSGIDFAADAQFPALIANNLRYGFNFGRPVTGDSVTLGDVSIECKNVTPSGLVGASSYNCWVTFYASDFAVKNGKIDVSPKTQNTIHFMVPVQRIVVPNAKPTLKQTRFAATVAD